MPKRKPPKKRYGYLLLLLTLGLLVATPPQVQAQRIGDVYLAAPMGIVVDAGLQFTPWFKNDSHGVVLRPVTVSLIALATKRDVFESVWGSLVSELCGHIWKLAHKKHN